MTVDMTNFSSPRLQHNAVNGNTLQESDWYRCCKWHSEHLCKPCVHMSKQQRCTVTQSGTHISLGCCADAGCGAAMAAHTFGSVMLANKLAC